MTQQNVHPFSFSYAIDKYKLISLLCFQFFLISTMDHKILFNAVNNAAGTKYIKGHKIRSLSTMYYLAGYSFNNMNIFLQFLRHFHKKNQLPQNTLYC